jgi:hypothetical protein
VVKLEFKNAVVKDMGYGLIVNGEPLDDIISTALGTKLKDNNAYNSNLEEFKSTCCNITVIIDPQPVTTLITDSRYAYESVEEMEAERLEQYNEKNAKTAPKE